MNLIENRAAELRSKFIENAIELGLLPEEIDAATDDSDRDDYFLREAENEARRAIAASRQNHRCAIRIASPRKPPTRRAPRRANKKVSAAGGDSDSDGPGPWSLQAIESFFAFKALPLLSPSLRASSGEFCKYQGPTILNRIPRVAVSVNCFGEYPARTFQISWADAATGGHGFSVISLVSHILKITEPAAADRLVRFAANALAASGASSNAETALERFKEGFVFPFERRAA